MAIDITGITNENEFYTHHYLSAILENDLKDLFSQWKKKAEEEEIPQPPTLLKGLRREFFTTLALLEKEEKWANGSPFKGDLWSICFLPWDFNIITRWWSLTTPERFP